MHRLARQRWAERCFDHNGPGTQRALLGAIVAVPTVEDWGFVVMEPDGEARLFELINDARQHPENYPPRGNSAGAIMAACENGFELSRPLTDIARDHSTYLKDQSQEWVTTGDNMHRDPSGNLVWDPGEPMEQAGYQTWRSENVAVGFTTPEEALQFWMQDDERFGWGHRNAILRGETHEAGVGHYEGGPWGHYWTLDMGTK